MSGWYFSRLEPSGTLLAVEPNGIEHVVKGCNLHSVDGERLFRAMVRDLTKDKAPRPAKGEAWRPQLPPTNREITIRGGGRSSTHFAYTAADVEDLMWQAYEQGCAAANAKLERATGSPAPADSVQPNARAAKGAPAATPEAAALAEWIEKTDWVQKTCTVRELGMHRADVLRQRIERAQDALGDRPR